MARGRSWFAARPSGRKYGVPGGVEEGLEEVFEEGAREGLAGVGFMEGLYGIGP